VVEAEKRIGNFRVNRKVEWGRSFSEGTLLGFCPQTALGAPDQPVVPVGDSQGRVRRSLRQEGWERFSRED
jgi:hypothetical protein